MSRALELHDELHGFCPGNQGMALVAYESAEVVTITTKYAVDFEDTSVTEDRDGWEWGLGGTRLNVQGITELRDYLNGVLAKIGA